MHRNISFILVTLVFIFGCAPQPTEKQKIAIEKKMVECLFAVNASVTDDESDGSPIYDAFAALEKLVENSSFNNKKWKLGTDEVSQKDTVTVEFENQETIFSCSFSNDSDGKYQIEKVLRNSEEVFDREENQRIKKEKVKLQALKRIEEIKQWQEKGYSNVAYKYYEKRHVDSQSSFDEPTLHVVCNPEKIQVKFNDGVLFGGAKAVEFAFLRPDNSILREYNLDSGGRVDEKNTHVFLDLLEASTGLKVGGTEFNVDDYSQVPCLSSRKADLVKRKEKAQAKLQTKLQEEKKKLQEEKKKFDSYLATIIKATDEGDISRDKVTGETTYIITDDYMKEINPIFGSVHSIFLAFVTVKSGDISSFERVRVFLMMRQYLESDEVLGRVKILAVNDSVQSELSFPCKFDYSEAIKSNGLAWEACNLAAPDMGKVRALRDAKNIRIASNKLRFDSIDGTDHQKQFIASLKRIVNVIAFP